MQKHSLITEHRLLIPSLALLALLALAPRAALAQSTWTGTTTGGDGATWESNLNWNNLSYPGATANDQEARFTNSPANTVTMNTALTIGGLAVNNNAGDETVSVTVSGTGGFGVGQDGDRRNINVGYVNTTVSRVGSFSGLSGGSFEAYAGAFNVGYRGGLDNTATVQGTMDFSGITTPVTLDVTTMRLGRNERGGGKTAGKGSATGLLDLSGASDSVLTVKDLFVGYGTVSEGMLRLGTNWTITVTNTAAGGGRGNVYVGGMSLINSTLSKGEVTLTGGSLGVYANEFYVGYRDSSDNTSASEGRLDFSSITTPVTLDVTTMRIGRNEKGGGTTGGSGSATGLLDLSGASDSVLTVKDLFVGWGTVSEGMLRLGTNWTITVTNTAAGGGRGNVYVGGWSLINSTLSKGEVTLTGGSLGVYANEFYVGYRENSDNTSASEGRLDFSSITTPVTLDVTTMRIGRNDKAGKGGVTGLLDLSGADGASTFAVGTLTIGYGYNATGVLKLGPGSGTVGTALIGDSNSGTSFEGGTGALELNGTTLAVTNLAANSLQIAAGSADSGSDWHVVTTRVGQASCGLDILHADDTALNVGGRGRIDIVFNGPQASGVYWGLRWAGSHAQTLTDLKTANKLNWDDTAIGGGVEIFEQAGFTYVGKIVAPRGTMILMR